MSLASKISQCDSNPSRDEDLYVCMRSLEGAQRTKVYKIAKWERYDSGEAAWGAREIALVRDYAYATLGSLPR